MFEQMEMAPPDPILGLTAAFKQDTTPGKINLGVGVYKDENNETPIFTSVKKAEEKILANETSKSYLPIEGSPEFGAAVQAMLFGVDSEISANGRAATAQAPGGTGALRVAGDFLRKARPDACLWVSNPTWSNHFGIFENAGFEVKEYPYYDYEGKCLDFDAMMSAIAAIPAGDIILLHGCCHNPSGMDPDLEQWKAIADAVHAGGLVALIDFAYQGLSAGLEEDCAGARLFCAPGREALICSSFSKNLGLYNERTGALTVVAASADAAKVALSHVQIAVRRNYSSPPSHGGAIATTVLSDPELRAEWEGEVAVMRERINGMRKLFVETMKAKGVTQDFSFIVEQSGMFSFSGLTKDQVEALRGNNAIYIVGSGRINVAGMTPANMDGICDAIAAVL